MSPEPRPATTADPYHFWLPPEDRNVSVGPEQSQVPLPQLPLPIKQNDKESFDAPSDSHIGSSIYDYLRQYPDCEYNREYAELLRDAYPHYISDLGAQVVMLSHKDVAAPYLVRLITYLKILLLLSPENHGLRQQIGLNYYQLAMNFESLPECRQHLLSARHFLEGEAVGDDLNILNHLAQIAYLFGDYSTARQYWQNIRAGLSAETDASPLDQRLEDLAAGRVPTEPLIEDLERVGEAMRHYGAGEFELARTILEIIEEQGNLYREFPLAEFHYLLGCCRRKCGETAAAFESFEIALEIDPDFQPAQEAREEILNAGG